MNILKNITLYFSRVIRSVFYTLAIFWKRKRPSKLMKVKTHDSTAHPSGMLTSHHRCITPPYWKKSTLCENCEMKATLVTKEMSMSHIATLPLISNMTLRQFLSHQDGFHLAMAPAFFGYFAYFGVLIAMNEMDISQYYKFDRAASILPRPNANTSNVLIKSVTGASAGAIAAAIIAVGANPRDAADFASSFTLESFADPPGFFGVFRGHLFEQIIVNFLRGARLDNAPIPVAVTAFDILSRKTKILNQGCAGRAARASATFPGLFQPVLYRNLLEADTGHPQTCLLIDGGIKDPYGLVGLTVLQPQLKNKRIVNMVVGGFGGPPPGPSQMPRGIDASEVVSISIKNTPDVNPFKMMNGSKAVRAANRAFTDVLDAPMYHGNEPGHYILPIDASIFCE